MPAFPSRLTVIALLVVACLLPAAGCGGGKKKKKGGATIAQRLERAKNEKTPDGQARELVKVARAQLTAGDPSGAASTLGEARKRLPESEPTPEVWAPRLTEIADVYAEMGSPVGKETLGRAEELAGTIGDAVTKAKALADIGAVYGAKNGGLGDAAAAKRVLAAAAETAASVEERFRAQALAAVATGYAGAGLAGEAGKMIEELETSARALAEPRPKAEALAAAARVRAAGDAAAAEPLFTEATAAAKSIEGNENRVYGLLAVAAALGDTGKAKEGLKLVAEAEKSAGKVGDPEAQKTALEKVRALRTSLDKKAK